MTSSATESDQIFDDVKRKMCQGREYVKMPFVDVILQVKNQVALRQIQHLLK